MNMIEVVVNEIKPFKDNGVEKVEIELTIDGVITQLKSEGKHPVDAVLGALEKHYGYEAKDWDLITRQIGRASCRERV